MRMAARPLFPNLVFRTSSARVHAAVLLALGGMGVAACSAGSREPINEGNLANVQELAAPNPCDGATLAARRGYQPARWEDGEVSFAAGTLTFVVPAFLAVSAGAAAHGKAKLTFSTGGGVPTVCVYRGDGAAKFIFTKCRRAEAMSPDPDDGEADREEDGLADALPVAGSTASADSFTLHVNRGDRKAGSTVVELILAGPVVDDGNVCTDDACDSAGQVTHTPVPAGTVVAGCSDHDACNGAEVCNGAGGCAPGTSPAIDDGNPCTADACDPAVGVTHTPLAAGVACPDGNACNGAETCDGAGACVAGIAPTVDDANPCTVDSCDPLTGVTHTALVAGASCSDGNLCNGPETCDGRGRCDPGIAPVLDDGDQCTADTCDAATGVAHVAIDSSFCRGKANFRDRTLPGLGGNGRSCADCHMPSQSFQLTPAAALARFTAMTTTGADDPLFRPIDADDFRVNGAAAADYTNLVQNGLIRVTIPLPPNVKLLNCGSTVPCPASAVPTSETVADVWRSVPSIFDVNLTGPDGAAPVWARGPNRSGGYQLDGRIDTLQNQALGALRGHGGITVDPPASFLDDIAAFQITQFSSPSVKLLSDAMAAGTSPLPDPDPALDELETSGKAVFTRSCAQCHGNLGGHPSTSTPILQGVQGTPTALVRYHDIATACPRPVDNVSPPRFSFQQCSPSQLRNVRTYEITNSGVAPSGSPCGGAPPQPACVTRLTTSDPGRLLLTGFPVAGGPGDIQHMDIPNLRGISRTAPYFVNNTAATLEEVLEHYKQFFKRVQVQAPAAPLLTTQPGVTPPVIDRPFTDAEVPALLAYLRKI